ncbi:MAG: DUF1440 domain-containing protein [Janthinobacterium lividum]
MSSRKKSILRGFVAGAAGGAMGTVALNFFQKGSIEATRAVEANVGNGETYTKQQENLLDTFEQAHVRTAETVASAVGTHIPPNSSETTALITEFAFGILCAGVYGALAEYVPAVTAGFGTVYGAALFTGASEAVLPAIKFVPPPTDRTPVQHLGGLAGNVVYGAVTEGIRILFRNAL